MISGASTYGEFIINAEYVCRPVAVGALVTTIVACITIMIKESLDTHDESSCYFLPNNDTNQPEFHHDWPSPTVSGFFQGIKAKK